MGENAALGPSTQQPHARVEADAGGAQSAIRAEVYGMESLKTYAQELARQRARLRASWLTAPLLRRFKDNKQVLERVYQRIVATARATETIVPVAEWFFDNFYIIREVLREVRRDLPRGFYNELPKLVEGPWQGYPRCYALAYGLVAHSDSNLTEAHLLHFLQSYQSVSPLTIGEIWAIPTMFRLVLIENLRRLAQRLAWHWDELARADEWFNTHAGQTATLRDSDLPVLTQNSDAFLIRVRQLLRETGQRGGAVLEFLENELLQAGIDPAALVHRENHRQASDQVSVGNCVTSLRLLALLDWREFFEKTSLVEPILQQDPAGVYVRQDFATRDRYRQALEQLARRIGWSDLELAKLLIERCRQHVSDPLRSHVGYHLIGAGRRAFEKQIGYRSPPRRWLARALLDSPNLTYFGGIGTTFILLAAALFGGLHVFGVAAWWVFVLVLGAAALPLSELAVGITNFLLGQILPARALPKLEMKDGIPADCATFVVMPTMLTQPQSAATLVGKLEIHYLANPDPQLRFALLTDFKDAEAETLPEDAGYVQAALAGVAELNRRYCLDGPERFFLFHRKRCHNPSEGCWMGWERKRGKLEEFNRLLRGARDTSYVVQSGDVGRLQIRYVITLDMDTQLPRDTARRLVGTLAHPLNRPHFDAGQKRIVSGYAILQPRVSIHIPAANRSWFARIWARSAGIDPYSTAVSDVYQDLFGSGSFTGKGIYDVDAFAAALGGIFPDNRILSHDLIEGNHARCGLVTDVETFDDFPARYHAYARREQRWVRGDWQLLPWLGRQAPLADGSARANPQAALERWKIVDNLRRSLVPPALVALLVLGWTVLPGPGWLWSALVALVLGLPVLQQAVGAALGACLARSLKSLAGYRRELPATLAQWLLSTAFLVNQSWVLLDAILRTLWRLAVSRRRLLEWESADATERRLGIRLADFLAYLWTSSAVALAVGVLLLLHGPVGSFGAALPFLVLWLLSPFLAYWVSQPIESRAGAALSEPDRQELRQLARRTWGFFETFVDDTSNWLPPDNFQEEPRPQIAHRTSPTNMGMMLLSTLAAHDLGYLSLDTLLKRTEKTFDTLDRLERHRGHFFNWYDTVRLQSLQPPYVSTVDSGNLLGCLITLRRGLLEKMDAPIDITALSQGVGDTCAVVTSLVDQLDDARARKTLRTALDRLLADAASIPTDLSACDQWLETLCASTQELADACHATPRKDLREIDIWSKRLSGLAHDQLDCLRGLAPWLPLLNKAPATLKSAARSTQQGQQQRRAHELAIEALKLRDRLLAVNTITDLARQRAGLHTEWQRLEAQLITDGLDAELLTWVRSVRAALEGSSAASLCARASQLADRARVFGDEMDFRFLYKVDRHLFAIGFNLTVGQVDVASYDLLASEASLTSFLTIARGEAPVQHWFHLGRLVTLQGGHATLVSWGGTMFEYLMPTLLLRLDQGTLLSESVQGAIARQVEYGRQQRVPWGISESAYSSQNINFDYQYQSFGVPGLGLKRDLGDDLVIAPYATALAAPFVPHAATANLRALHRAGAAGRYGFYEALDFTADRLPEDRARLVVRCFMAHHQGMSLVALTNALLDGPMPRRFHAEPMVRATALLLQERSPASVTSPPTQEPMPAGTGEVRRSRPVSRRLTSPHTAYPRTHLMSNGAYTVMLTNAGSGYSSCQGRQVTRWREDSTRDHWGQFIYLRDLHSGQYWSAGFQPTGKEPDDYEVIFSLDKAEMRRSDHRIETRTSIAVSSESNIEVRQLTLVNHDVRPRDIEVTSYAEIVLTSPGADLAHPAFHKLFVETEWLDSHEVLLAHRRAPAAENQPWALHLAVIEGEKIGPIEYETERGRFLGRGHTTAAPAALLSRAPLSGTLGPVLDPIFSLRCRFRLLPGATAHVTFATGVAASRDEAVQLADQLRDPQGVQRVFELAWAQGQIDLEHLRLNSTDAHLYQRLASQLLYGDPGLRPSEAVLAGNRQGQSALWKYGISGDRPIVLVHITGQDELPLLQQVLEAHAYWRLKGLEADLVVICEEPTCYIEQLYLESQKLIRVSDAHQLSDKPGGVFLRKGAELAPDDRVLLHAAARIVLHGRHGSLAAHLEHQRPAPELPARLPARRGPDHQEPEPAPLALPADLLFANGHGGFTPDGREYVIFPYAQQADGSVRLNLPPAPWINVIANATFGCTVSEAGAGCTWHENSQQNRLTPWHNDPVCDTPGEAIYLLDEASGAVWTPTPLPAARDLPTLVRHGQGYSVFEQRLPGLDQQLTVFVAAHAPVKILHLHLHNRGSKARQLSAAYFVDWVLGSVRERSSAHVVTHIDEESGALFAWNAFNAAYPEQIAFCDVNLRPRQVTGDRGEFIGRNGSISMPAALQRVRLSGRVGAGFDPCAAVQTFFEVAAGAEIDVIFVLGQARSRDEARELVKRYREPSAARAALDEVRQRWNTFLEVLQVETPDPAIDVLLNRWLPYQVQGCRVWGRTAFYQSGGAYGFRDQLQDVLALVYARPAETRAQISRAASRQFIEGDVQHWWHPPLGQGTRTRCSDDFLWLPFAVCHYVRITGDHSILAERVPFLESAPLSRVQQEDYQLPDVSKESGTIYEHCLRALAHARRYGPHDLPLIGSGDWNDGYNLVGAGGQGESIWVAWFLQVVLRDFEVLAKAQGDEDTVVLLHEQAQRLQAAVETHGWDGEWYRRAYFDDATPLGSVQNDECRIDSLAQTWAAIAGTGDPARAELAFRSLLDRLVRWQDRLVLLLAPPFDQGSLQPGYIKGYLPGIRENGGQYTHAAVWCVLAAALRGAGSLAVRLYQLLNPVHHARSPADVARYKVEPYVIAADVYATPPHTGRGGWTWYTGSASWFYRVGIESLLGFQKMGDRLRIAPCISQEWANFTLTYRHGSSTYRIEVANPERVERGVKSTTIDGQPCPEGLIPLRDDGQTHEVRVVLGT